jgi:putative flippase GtrA
MSTHRSSDSGRVTRFRDAIVDAFSPRPTSHPLPQLVRYCVIAGGGYLLAVAAYSFELKAGVPPYLGLGIAFVLNGLFNFALIRMWAFPSSGRSVGSDLARFCGVAAVSFIVNYAVFATLYSAIGLAADTSQRLGILIAAPVTFLGNRAWSFRAHRPGPRSSYPDAGTAPTSAKNESYPRM